MKFTYSSGSRPLDGYTIKRGVGHGGFGEVYYAVSDGGKEVALKLVLRNLDVELRGVAQCMNLKHPNLITLYDLRTNDAGEHFVVMEYVAGKCLAEIVEQHPNGMPLEEVNRWMRGICAGIGYLHDKGIVHRDLKPGNLFLEDGVVKIGDYGLSKFITASRRSGQTESVGTVHYMAPEISRGKYDREIDVYATGVMLYEMITGHVPFHGESVGEILMKHLTAQPDVSKLPPPYDQVAARALAKDPVARFRTMEQLAGGLNGRLSNSPETKLKETVAYVPPVPERPVELPRAGSAPPAAVPPAATDFVSRVRSTIVKWWDRPWSATDYVIAFPVLVLLGFVAITLMPIAVAFVPWAMLGLLVVWAIRKAADKDREAEEKKFRGPAGNRPPPPAAPVPPVATVPNVDTISPRPNAPATLAVAPSAAAVPQAPLRLPVVPLVPKPAVLQKPARTRLAEASSSMLLTAVLSVIASVLAAGLMGWNEIEQCALLAGTCLAACWAVIVPAKIWEGTSGDAVVRRLVMAMLGLGVGAWCSYLAGILQVEGLETRRSPGMLDALDWLPRLLIDGSYFALVFLLPRWWTLADGRRVARFNPWLAIGPCFWAFLVSVGWSQQHEPELWTIVLIGMVSILVQLASPWDEPAPRRKAA